MVTRLPELQKGQPVDKHVLLSIYFDMSWIEKSDIGLQMISIWLSKNCLSSETSVRGPKQLK